MRKPRRVLDLSNNPIARSILEAAAKAHDVRAHEMITRRRLPYKSPAARARRAAMVALHKRFENVAAIARIFGRSVHTIWAVINRDGEWQRMGIRIEGEVSA